MFWLRLSWPCQRKGDIAMPGSEDREFIREKIVDKAATPRHRVMKVVRLLVTAIVFGLVASLFFVLGKRYLEPHFLSSETTPSETINIGRDDMDSTELDPETSLEDMTGEDPEESSGEASGSEGIGSETSDSTEETTLEENMGESVEDPEALLAQQIQAAADKAVEEALLRQEEYLALGWYRQVNALVKNIHTGLVTVNSMTQDKDWFDNPISNADQSAGAIIYTTDAEVLILVDYPSVADAESISVTFFNGKTLEARVKKADSITGIAIVSVSKAAIPELLLRGIRVLPLGNSYQVDGGTPVLAAGCPVGYTGSVTMGMISLVQTGTVGTDTAFQLLYPDMQIAPAGTGFLFNTDGEIVGILSGKYGDEGTGLARAIGISSLKGIVEKLSSGIDAAYLGIQGQNATADIAATYEMPTGIYVTKVVVDSPAYLAGIKAGDVIKFAEQTELPTMYKLQTFLESYSTGDVIKLKVYRGGQDEYVEMEFAVTLGAR